MCIFTDKEDIYLMLHLDDATNCIYGESLCQWKLHKKKTWMNEVNEKIK